MKIQTVIVEDSRLARNELKELMKKHDFLELIGEAENVDEGIELIERVRPDLLLLDINMPEKDGFELLELLDFIPITVFTTAFDQYAIKSFEYNALDYLLKPINEDRFDKAIEKVKEKLNNSKFSKQLKGQKIYDNNSQIFIRDGEKCWMVKIEDIILLEIVGNYTRVFFKEDNALVYKSLIQVEQRLPETIFFRANRQQIMNLKHIKEVVPWFNGKLKITMTNTLSVEISRRQSYVFKDLLSI